MVSAFAELKTIHDEIRCSMSCNWGDLPQGHCRDLQLRLLFGSLILCKPNPTCPKPCLPQACLVPAEAAL